MGACRENPGKRRETNDKLGQLGATVGTTYGDIVNQREDLKWMECQEREEIKSHIKV